MSVKFKLGSSKSGRRINGSFDLQGSKLPMSLEYGGLGNKYFEQLAIEPDKILQVDILNNLTETKGSIRSRAVQLAVEMHQRGIKRNDIILILSRTHAHQTVTVLASLFLGAIVAPLNPDSSQRESLDLVRRLKPKMCFCDSRTISQIERIVTTLGIVCEVVNFGHEVVGTVQFCKLFPFKEDNDFKPVFVEDPQNDVAFIIPTQGTCGDPKLVCLSHQNIYVQSLNLFEIFNHPSQVISFFPLSWILQTVLCCMCFDFGIVRIIPGTFSERMACKVIHDFKIDAAVFGTDLMMRLTENVAIRDYNLSCLKCVLIGVINTSKNDLRHMRMLLPNVKFLQVYFTTETGLIAAVSADNYGKSLEKAGSVGQILTNGKIKIIDIHTKEPIGPGQCGELYFSGDGIMLGYFKDNASTLAAIEKGYFKTGDMAKYDNEGWMYLQGKITDLIPTPSNNRFSPLDLEDIILSHPLVFDVAIIGNTSDLIVCIQKKAESALTSEKMMSFIAERFPQARICSKIIFYDEFPRTSTGMIKKRYLRDEILKVKIEYTKSLASISPSPQLSRSNSQ